MKMYHLYVIKTQICQNWRERKKQYRKRIASPEFSVSTYFGLLARLHWICCFERCHKTENFWHGTIHFKWKHVDDITTTILKLLLHCLLGLAENGTEPSETIKMFQDRCSGTDTEFHFPDLWSQRPKGAKFRTFPDQFWNLSGHLVVN